MGGFTFKNRKIRPPLYRFHPFQKGGLGARQAFYNATPSCFHCQPPISPRPSVWPFYQREMAQAGRARLLHLEKSDEQAGADRHHPGKGRGRRLRRAISKRSTGQVGRALAPCQSQTFVRNRSCCTGTSSLK